MTVGTTLNRIWEDEVSILCILDVLTSAAKFLHAVRVLFPEMSQFNDENLVGEAFVAKDLVMLEKNLEHQCPLLVCTELFIFSSTRSPHIQARPQFKDLHFSKQLSLFGGEETDSEYYLQTANLHTASLWKGLFPQAGRGIKKDRGLQQADSTLHHAQHRHQQKAL